ncbi:MAG: hypothetical protein ABII79_00915 [bacterium]
MAKIKIFFGKFIGVLAILSVLFLVALVGHLTWDINKIVVLDELQEIIVSIRLILISILVVILFILVFYVLGKTVWYWCLKLFGLTADPAKLIQDTHKGIARVAFIVITGILFAEAGITGSEAIFGIITIPYAFLKITIEAIAGINMIGLHVAMEPLILREGFVEKVTEMRKHWVLYLLLAGNVVLGTILALVLTHYIP